MVFAIKFLDERNDEYIYNTVNTVKLEKNFGIINSNSQVFNWFKGNIDIGKGSKCKHVYVIFKVHSSITIILPHVMPLPL